MVDMKLEKTNVQIHTDLGIIDIWQVEDSEVFTVEIFPPNQDANSFNNAEFSNIWNVFDACLNMDFIQLSNHPKEWTHEQYCDMRDKALQGVYSLVCTITNLDDFKYITYQKLPVYDSLFVIRNKYNDDYCKWCGCKLDDSNRRQDEYEITVCEDCFIENKSSHLTRN